LFVGAVENAFPLTLYWQGLPIDLHPN
jgi:hypothetical protein